MATIESSDTQTNILSLFAQHHTHNNTYFHYSLTITLTTPIYSLITILTTPVKLLPLFPHHTHNNTCQTTPFIPPSSNLKVPIYPFVSHTTFIKKELPRFPTVTTKLSQVFSLFVISACVNESDYELMSYLKSDIIRRWPTKIKNNHCFPRHVTISVHCQHCATLL